MTCLDDFLAPLFEGIKEVIVPKKDITEPLDQGWKKSSINIPSPKMIDSYRKGPLHVHEYADEYRVHLDRYDPEKHALLHLIDDAPMLLMIWGTVSTLSREAAEAARGGLEDKMHSLRGTYRARILVGAAVVLIGVMIFLFPLEGWTFLFEFGIPGAIVFLGAAEILGAFYHKKEEKFVDVAVGAIVVMLGILLFATTYSEILIIYFALSVWLFASGFLSISSYMRARKVSERDARPKLVIGIISVIMGIGVLFLPIQMFALLMLIFGFMVMLVGAFMIASGYGLRHAAKTIEASRAAGSKQGSAADR